MVLSEDEAQAHHKWERVRERVNEKICRHHVGAEFISAHIRANARFAPASHNRGGVNEEIISLAQEIHHNCTSAYALLDFSVSAAEQGCNHAGGVERAQ
jgi:hypothetical protein